jgi:hypothetical protein
MCERCEAARRAMLVFYDKLAAAIRRRKTTPQLRRDRAPRSSVNLRDMSLGQRVVLTVAIVIVALLLLAAFGYLTGRWDDTAGAQPLVPSKFDSDLVELDKEAVKQAYHDQVVHLFAIWMKDEKGQPDRALVGVRQARRAYVEAMTAIERREQKQ